MTEFRAVAGGYAVSDPIVANAPPVLVGSSTLMERLRRDVLRAAGEGGPVLVSGEVGTGKSLVARALHEMGPRANQPCAVVACQAFPEALLEIELFGCAKGNGVGANGPRQGVLEMVDGGTVILEHVEAMSSRTQSLLERFLETGHLQSVCMRGPGNPVRARVVATTAESTADAAMDPRHDSTLWTRLRVNEVRVPPLRERQADVPLLSQFFSTAGDGHGHGVVFSAEAMSALSAYPWPGNVAQLKSVVERLVSQAQSGQIRQADLPVGIRPRGTGTDGFRGSDVRSEDAARGPIRDALFRRLVSEGESFWTGVYPLFMQREITRADVRALIQKGLAAARGEQDILLRLFNLPTGDRKRFERFLRKYDLPVPLQFRASRATRRK